MGHLLDYRFLSLDPGSVTTGMAISVATKEKMIVQDAYTLHLDRLAALEPVRLDLDRTQRLAVLTKAVERYATAWQPSAVFCESPFLQGKVNTFATLTEALVYIQHGVWAYNPRITIGKMDPATVKKSVGVSGKSKDKEDMRRALYKVADLETLIPYDTLDEHSIDAIAVGYYFYRNRLKGEL